MTGLYNEKRNVGYEIQFYNESGSKTLVRGCEDLKEVAEVLIATCNGRVKGNFPTVWLDGKLINSNMNLNW